MRVVDLNELERKEKELYKLKRRNNPENNSRQKDNQKRTHKKKKRKTDWGEGKARKKHERERGGREE